MFTADEMRAIASKREQVRQQHGDDTCDSCNGSGVYWGRGYVENGAFKGFTGDCFRCQGKGFQTPADVKRNRAYDRYGRRAYA